MKFGFTVILIVIISLSAAGQSAADLILVNAKVRTMDANNPRAEAVAVAKGVIISVGKSAEIEKFAGPKTRRIDALGRLVIPGFNDSHVHFAGIGNQFSHLDMRGIRSGDEMLKKIAFFARFVPKGRWLIGAGLETALVSDLPSLEKIDAALADNPLLIYTVDIKSAITNSAGIRLAGLRDGKNLVAETDIARLRSRIPADHGKNWREIVEAASKYAASLGVTSVQDVHSDNLLADLKYLVDNGLLKTRVYECVGIKDRLTLAKSGLTAATGTGMVRGGCVKGLADGSIEEPEELRNAIAEADKNRLQVMIHAIGPQAVGNALDAFEFATRSNGSRDRRFRVEHAHNVQRTDFARFATSQIIASMQPNLFFMGESGGGDDFRGLAKFGVRMAFGSDASIAELDPMLGIYAAANSGAQSISVEDAVAAYTVGSAFAEFQENVKGTITIGKFADMVILSEDIFAIDRRRIRAVKTLLTIVNGEIVFRDEAF